MNEDIRNDVEIRKNRLRYRLYVLLIILAFILAGYLTYELLTVFAH